MAWFEGFSAQRVRVGDHEVFARAGGRVGAPALVLLHGFPQTHVMWHRVAQALSRDYFIVLPDLRGYGDSSLPAGEADHAQASKRALAADIVGLADAMGIDQFFLCGHDRGGRVAHRLALDHPTRVRKLCVLDIAPTLDMYEATDMAFARAYYHWFMLIQPAPLPETLIGGDPLGYLRGLLGGWGGTGLAHLEPEALAEYERCFVRPAAIHAACEDYRASAGIDLEHDRQSRQRGERIACDTHVIWGERGVIGRMFEPLALWQAQCAGMVTGRAVPSGHFIPEELPELTTEALATFFR